MGKTQKPCIINNKYQTEIDYEKLAKAIIDAQKESVSEESYVKDTFTFLTSSFFTIIAWVCLLAGIVLAIGTIYSCVTSFTWIGAEAVIHNVLIILLLLLLMIIVFLFSKLLFNSAKELEKEKDKNFVVAVFSGVASFAAVIVALVALIKG